MRVPAYRHDKVGHAYALIENEIIRDLLV